MNGVPQRRARTTASRAGTSSSSAAAPGGQLGFWRWLSMLLGVAGTYRQNDSSTSSTSAAGRRGRQRLPLEARSVSVRTDVGRRPVASAPARSQAACPAGQLALRRRQRQLPPSARTVHPTLLAEAEHVLAGTIAERGARGERQLDQPHGSPREALGQRGGVAGGGVDDLVLAVVLQAVRVVGSPLREPRAGRPCREAELVAEPSTSGVISPRSSAITRSGPSSPSAARNGSAPGPGRHRPRARRVARPPDRPVAAKPRKWSIRTRRRGRAAPHPLDPPAIAARARPHPSRRADSPIAAAGLSGPAARRRRGPPWKSSGCGGGRRSPAT